MHRGWGKYAPPSAPTVDGSPHPRPTAWYDSGRPIRCSARTSSRRGSSPLPSASTTVSRRRSPDSLRLDRLLPAAELPRELAPGAHQAHLGRVAAEAEPLRGALDAEVLEVDEPQDLALRGPQEVEREIERHAALALVERAEAAARGEAAPEVPRFHLVDPQGVALGLLQALHEEPPGRGPQVGPQLRGTVEPRRRVDLEEAYDRLLRDVAHAHGVARDARSLAPQAVLQEADLEPQELVQRIGVALLLPAMEQARGRVPLLRGPAVVA